VARHLSGETLAKFDYAWVNRDPERAMIIGELQKEQKDIVPTNNPPTEQSMTNKKIHIREFCGTKEEWENTSPDKVIYCDTAEKAELLCKAFGLLGLKWKDGDSYMNNDGSVNYCRSEFGKNNYQYYTNNGLILNSEFKKILPQSFFYDFNEIDFNTVLPQEDIDRINNIEYLEKIY